MVDRKAVGSGAAPAIRLAEMRAWENEGGALDTFAGALPDGITSRIVREYCVGPYRYTDLAQALAERGPPSWAAQLGERLLVCYTLCR